MIALICDDLNIVGLRKDGTVASTDGEMNKKVADWRDIINISLSQGSFVRYVLGLRRDGTVVTTDTGEIAEQISNWRLFNSIDTLEQERKEGLENARAARIAKEKAEAERRAQKRSELLAEQARLQAELSQLKGLFSGRRRKEIELLLTGKRHELQKLEEQP